MNKLTLTRKQYVALSGLFNEFAAAFILLPDNMQDAFYDVLFGREQTVN